MVKGLPTSQPSPDTTKPKPDNLSGSTIIRQGWILFALGISTFMAALDGSVVNTILPVIANVFEVDITRIQWVITVYMLVLSGLLLSFGRLGDLRGHKTVYVSGFAVFIISSVLCGLAPGVGALIVFRAFQALGAAMLSANSPAILTKAFPAAQRGQALGIMATMTYLGLTTGPSFGGWLASQVGWRWVFYINLPVGLFAIWLALRHIPKDHGSGSREKFDPIGALTFTGGLVTLLYALNQGHALGWSSLPITLLLAASLLILGGFLLYERRIPHPMLDLTLFRHPLFSISVISAILNYICVYSVLFLLPFYLIEGRGLNSAQAGLLLTAQPIIMAIVAPLSGTISDRIGTRLPTALGMGLLSAGLVFLAQLGPESSQLQIVVGLAWVGFGTGIFISPNNSALMGSAPRHRQGIAAGILATARNGGMALGVGFAGAVFSTILTRGQAADVPEALFSAFSTTFYAAAGIAALGGLLSLLRNSKIVVLGKSRQPRTLQEQKRE
jgi:EmrB/QacA subfamily drug resistance transporter